MNHAKVNKGGHLICPDCNFVIRNLLNAGAYKLGASGAGLVVYQVLSPTKVRLLLTQRATVVGRGLGITGGGYVELGDISNLRKGTIIDTAEEAYREVCQENLGFEKLFSLEDFLLRAQPIAQLQVSTPVTVHDKSGVHTTNYYGLHVTSANWDAISKLLGNEEREGSLIEALLETDGGQVSRVEPEKSLSIRAAKPGCLQKEDFYHQHELRAISMIGWLLQEGYLWKQKPI